MLEVGCGTGKLTEALVERGLVVDAVDPGANMIAFARKRVRDADAVEFHLGRFEELPLPEQVFDAVFSAAAFHWIDPEVGWAKAARCLRPGGTLALIMHMSYRDERTAADDEALHEVFRKYWLDPSSWHPLRDLAAIRAGVEERRENVSAVWTWLGHRDLYNAGAAGLFDDVQLTTQPLALEQTADQLWALFETTSLYPAPRFGRARGAGGGDSCVLRPAGRNDPARASSPSSSPPAEGCLTDTRERTRFAL